MKTRDKILAKAQEMFNLNGIRQVSVRSICEELAISLGNFTYYYPGKDKVIAELFHRMISELLSVPESILVSRNSILYVLVYHTRVFSIQNDYRFFYLNTFELLTQYPELKHAYLNYKEHEKTKMEALFTSLLANGTFKEEVNPDTLKRMISIGQMVNNFWIIDAELHFSGNDQEKLIYYLNLCCSLIEPLLADHALREYQEYFISLEQQ